MFMRAVLCRQSLYSPACKQVNLLPKHNKKLQEAIAKE